MENSFENKESKFPEKIRISVNNFLRALKIKETGEVYFPAVQGKKPIKIDGVERKRFQALGGAAKVTKEGKKRLENEYGGSFGIPGRPEEENDDARFFVDIPENLRNNDEETTSSRNNFISELLSEFTEEQKDLFEFDPKRELYEELVTAGIISEEDFNSLAIEYQGTNNPIFWKDVTSERMSKEIPSYRVFHLHDAVVSKDIFEKIKSSPVIRMLSPEDMEDLKKSTEEGKPAGVMRDGSVIVENIFPDLPYKK